MTQLASRGLRNAPVKNTRNMCTNMAATKINAAQWCICRMNRPPRTSNEISSVDSRARDISTPWRFLYGPSYTTSAIEGSKNSVG